MLFMGVQRAGGVAVVWARGSCAVSARPVAALGRGRKSVLSVACGGLFVKLHLHKAEVTHSPVFWG